MLIFIDICWYYVIYLLISISGFLLFFLSFVLYGFLFPCAFRVNAHSIQHDLAAKRPRGTIPTISLFLCWYLLMFVDICWYLSIFVRICWLLFHIYWYLFIFVDICWCLLIFAHIWLYLIVFVGTSCYFIIFRYFAFAGSFFFDYFFISYPARFLLIPFSCRFHIVFS